MTMRPLWNAAPDWSSSVTETLSWKTDVLTSPSGAEQRIARRRTPRRTFEFTVELSGAERRAFENLLWHAGAGEWDLPVFPDVATLRAPLVAGDTFIPVDTAGRDFIAGDNVLIQDYDGTRETARISAVKGDGLTVSELVLQWSPGAEVYPLRPAVLTDPPARTRQTGELARWQVRFRIAASNPVLADAGPVFWRGHPVLTAEPDRTDDLTGEYERMIAELDNMTGIVHRTDTAGRAFAVQGFAWLEAGRVAQTRLRALFYFLRGRQRPLWVPGDAIDFIPVSTSGNELQTRTADYSASGIANGRRDLCIRLADGSQIYRRIVSAVSLNNGERLTLNDELPPVEQITDISFMTLCRLNSDEIQWQHITDADGLASVSVNFRGVRDELE